MPIPQNIEEGSGLPDRLEGRNPILEAIKAGRAINKLWVAKREERQDPALGRLDHPGQRSRRRHHGSRQTGA